MMSSRHGSVFQVRDVRFSLKGFKFSGEGVFVVKKKINFVKPEVEFSKNIKIQARQINQGDIIIYILLTLFSNFYFPLL